MLGWQEVMSYWKAMACNGRLKITMTFISVECIRASRSFLDIISYSPYLWLGIHATVIFVVHIVT